MMENALFNDKPFLSGGPYLELCVILEDGSRPKFFEHVLAQLSTFPVPSHVDMASAQKESGTFINGWLFDEDDPKSRLFETGIAMVIDIVGWRKCSVIVKELWHMVYQLDFMFFGSRYDAAEWHQLGVPECEDQIYHELLGKICTFFKADLGMMGFEMDVASFFSHTLQDPGCAAAYDRLLSTDVASSADIEALGFRPEEFEAIYFKGGFIPLLVKY